MSGRFGQAPATPNVAHGWRIQRLCEPAPLVGSNGMRWGPDNRLYVAQAFGNQISALDLDTGNTEIISPADGPIIAPDDLDFDSHGNLYATEVMSARVSVRRTDGSVDVVASDVPVANGITVHGDRIFMSEFRPEGRILELFADGRAPRVIADGLMMPNALSQGPDGYLYFPLVPLGEIWRVRTEGASQAEKVAGGFDIPTACKVSPDGGLVVVEAGSGAVTRIDVVSGERRSLGRSAYGIDNLAFGPGGHLFVSHFTDGSVDRIEPDGRVRPCASGGLLGPFGISALGDGAVLIADGMSFATLGPDGRLGRPAMLLQHGFPGFVRGVAVDESGAIFCTNSAGSLNRYTFGEEAQCLADGLEEPMGLAISPSGGVLLCEKAKGRLLSIDGQGKVKTLATGLDRPIGVDCDGGGQIYVAESGGGRVSAIVDGALQTLAAGLVEPHGIAAASGTVFVLDRGDRSLHAVDLAKGQTTVLVRDLPLSAGAGRRINPLPGIADLMPGPLLPFADLATLPDGRLAIGCDGDGSILALERATSPLI